MSRLWTSTARYRRRVGTLYQNSASVVSFNHDGLEIARVRRRRTTRWLPLWHILVFIYLILLIRLVALVDIGPAGYGHRIEQMRNGTVIEKAAATIMDMDPLSRRLAAELRVFVDFIGGQ